MTLHEIKPVPRLIRVFQRRCTPSHAEEHSDELQQSHVRPSKHSYATASPAQLAATLLPKTVCGVCDLCAKPWLSLSECLGPVR